MSGGAETTTRSEQDLDRALDRGAMKELPPNHPPGWLGEVAPDMRKVEDFVPTLNAGVVQEQTPQTRWLLILVFYAMLFTAPVAAWLLWREPRVSLRSKVWTTLIGIVGYVALYWATTTLGPAG